MRKSIFVIVTLAGFVCCAAQPVAALPTLAPGGSVETNDQSDVQDTRIYCFNRYTGRFLHWGRCGGGYYRPRVYCRNTYTGRFLHWGSCW